MIDRSTELILINEFSIQFITYLLVLERGFELPKLNSANLSYTFHNSNQPECIVYSLFLMAHSSAENMLTYVGSLGVFVLFGDGQKIHLYLFT